MREGGEGEREYQCERNIDWLPPVCATTRDQTCSLGVCSGGNGTHSLSVCGTMFQPTEPPGQGLCSDA